jgi:shikimate kinase
VFACVPARRACIVQRALVATPPERRGGTFPEMSTDMDETSLIERVVLVGYLGAGKSVVGRALAMRLDWNFVDFDAEVERREGKSMGVIAEEAGAEYLRQAERALTEEVIGQPHLVIAPGGGWITQPELLESLGPTTLSVWLKVTPSEAYERILGSSDDHPVHHAPDAMDQIGSTMRERESLYRLTDVSVPTNWRSPEQIAFEIEQIIRTRGCRRPFVEAANGGNGRGWGTGE